MFIQLASEFVMGYFMAIDVVIVDVLLINIVCGLVSDDSQIVDVFGYEFSYVDVEDSSVVSEVAFELLNVIGVYLCDNMFAGYLSDGATPAVFVAMCLIEAIMAMLANISLNISTGLDSFGILVGGNTALAIGLAVCEVLAYGLRPLSLAVRLFANMTSGVLLSGLLLPTASIGLVDAVAAQDVNVSVVALMAYFVSAVALSLGECCIGVIQTYVFMSLSDAYAVFRV